MSRNKKKRKKIKNTYSKNYNKKRTTKTKNTHLKSDNSKKKTYTPVVKKSKSKHSLIKIITYLLIIIALLSIILIISLSRNKNKPVEIKDVYLESDKIIVELNTNANCSLDNITWVESKYETCAFEFTPKIEYIYTKYKDKIIKHDITKDFSIVNKILIENDNLYLAIEGKEKINYSIISKGIVDINPTFTSSDENIAHVDENGVVTGISAGEATIKVALKNKEATAKVLVTDLIVKRPKEFNYSKSYLSCNKYSKEENDLFDEILKARVNSVGKSTRAAVAEVARFIGLEFPYRLNYFSENGRLNSNRKGIDGEGRYYHEGLYLHSSRFKNLSSSLYGPGTWGCKFYSIPPALIQNNGLDCSGFVSWVMLNAGFDVGDLGAGISSGQDLTDLGVRIKMTTALEEGKVKVGDLLSQEVGGEHIAIVAGIKNGYYFVAESLWYGTGYLGMVIRKYDKTEFIKNFYWLVDMSTFYESDGKLTDYWEY